MDWFYFNVTLAGFGTKKISLRALTEADAVAQIHESLIQHFNVPEDKQAKFLECIIIENTDP